MPAPSGQLVQSRDAPERQAAPNEPSMEDILASIRRIIAADQTAGSISGRFMPSAQTAPSDSDHTAEEAGQTLDGSSDAAGAAHQQPSPQISDGASGWASESGPHHPGPVPNLDDLADAIAPPAHIVPDGFEETADEHLSHHLPPPAPMFAHENHPLASNDIYDLQHSEAVNSADPGHAEPLISMVAGAAVSSSFQALARTVLLQDPEMIERIAREALRPMLKAWLDENLPSMVERLVRAEIERVARGGRSRD